MIERLTVAKKKGKKHVPCILSFMRADDGEKVVALKEGTSGVITKEVRASTDVVMDKSGCTCKTSDKASKVTLGR